ncbi:acyl-CoA thioester hydrolase, YbgC/YbaW family [Bacteriovorax sp. BSW11_IV]|uniref:acyl-CoA thioesterase n=1 Tax=Bacteriovorax sp. BSW11_IV TaxID=1353529 RepID=UPI00038A3690|nr:acyl-CoA thioesterase [Bacteriovorax sp. BSW11_IV]EQC48165.1 acyl-CoA thioester hydrolase, YbgC/YbaW family [Bacteriovorax sp. BSW11_IV]
MLSKPHFYDLKIVEKHLDTFGHVNNATYLELYEEARWDLIDCHNYGLKHIQESGQGPVILRIDITFKAELKNRELIKIETYVKEVKNALVMTLEQKMIKADGTIASTATFDVGLFDLHKRKLIPPTKDWLHAIGVDENLIPAKA